MIISLVGDLSNFLGVEPQEKSPKPLKEKIMPLVSFQTLSTLKFLKRNKPYTSLIASPNFESTSQ
jgi:hypothetical protein